MATQPQPTEDEWIVGNSNQADDQYREFIAHLVKPRFTARVVKYDDNGIPDPEHEPADLSGYFKTVDLEKSEGCIVLFNFDWIDDPNPEVKEMLMTASSVIYEIHEARNKLYKLHILENEDWDSI